MEQFDILLGNCLEILPSLPEASVQCCVTSPPYWGLRDYQTSSWIGGDENCDHVADSSKTKKFGNDAFNENRPSREETKTAGYYFRDICSKCGAKRSDLQLGLEQTPEEYVANMVLVFREVWRVLRDDGTLWLNLGDSYNGSGKGANGDGSAGKAGNINSGSKGTQQGTFTKSDVIGLKPKDLVGIPWRVALALQADGWWLRQDIIWHKPNPMPESVTDRCTKAHEYIFLLTKSAKYFYDSEAVKERGVMVAGDSAGSTQRDTQETHGLGGGNSGINLAKQKLATELQEKGYSTRNKRSVWTVTTKPFRGAHFATFPPDLIEPCILAGSATKCCAVCGAPWERVVERIAAISKKCPKTDSMYQAQGGTGEKKTGTIGMSGGGRIDGYSNTLGYQPTCECGGETQPSMVLDPFSGAGTTGAVAVQHDRRYIGIELNPDYLEMSRKRIQLVRDSITIPLF